MRFVALFAVVIFALPIAGCSLAIRSQGIEATDLSAIVVGADRETVEGVLGSTIDRVETETGRIDTYRYDRGRAPDAARASSSGWSGSGGGGPGAGYALTLLALGYLIAQPVLIHNLYEEQKGELSITYGADDTVVRIENARQRNQRELREDLSAVLIGATRGQVEELLGAPESSGEDGQVHEYRHQRGDAKDVVYVTYGPEGAVANAETAEQRHARHQRELREDLSVIRIGATREQVEAVLGVSESGSDAAIQQYLHRWGSAYDTVYVTYGPDGTVTRSGTAAQYREEKKQRDIAELLAKAQCGEAQAQYEIGNRYRHGVRGIRLDRVEAALWLGLASRQQHKHAATSLARLREHMTPEQIAEAERLTAVWQPEDCSASAGMVTTEEVIENQ